MGWKRTRGQRPTGNVSLMERAFEVLQAAVAIDEAAAQGGTSSNSDYVEAMRLYREAVEHMEAAAALERDAAVKGLILENVKRYKKRAEEIDMQRAQLKRGEHGRRSPHAGGGGELPPATLPLSTSPPRSPPRPPLMSPPSLSRSTLWSRHPVEATTPREPPSSSRRLQRSPSKLALEFSAATTLCCCGAVQKQRLESMYELCIKPVKEGYPVTLLRGLGWGLVLTQVLVLSSYLYEVGHSCEPPEMQSSSTVFWGIPLCCIYASSDSLKSLFRFLPLTLYTEDPLVTRQAVAMAAMVVLLALYQMYAIGLVMSQEGDIVNLISDFVGVTIVTKSNELIADILELEDADPSFIRNLAVRARLRELAEENAAAAADAAAVAAGKGAGSDADEIAYDAAESCGDGAPAQALEDGEQEAAMSPARRLAAAAAAAAVAVWRSPGRAAAAAATAADDSTPPASPAAPREAFWREASAAVGSPGGGTVATAGAMDPVGARGTLPRGGLRQRVRQGRRHFVARAAQRLGRTYKNPIKRLWWIASGALAIGLVTWSGRRYRYFCVADAAY